MHERYHYLETTAKVLRGNGFDVFIEYEDEQDINDQGDKPYVCVCHPHYDEDGWSLFKVAVVEDAESKSAGKLTSIVENIMRKSFMDDGFDRIKIVDQVCGSGIVYTLNWLGHHSNGCHCYFVMLHS